MEPAKSENKKKFKWTVVVVILIFISLLLWSYLFSLPSDFLQPLTITLFFIGCVLISIRWSEVASILKIVFSFLILENIYEMLAVISKYGFLESYSAFNYYFHVALLLLTVVILVIFRKSKKVNQPSKFAVWTNYWLTLVLIIGLLFSIFFHFNEYRRWNNYYSGFYFLDSKNQGILNDISRENSGCTYVSATAVFLCDEKFPPDRSNGQRIDLEVDIPEKGSSLAFEYRFPKLGDASDFVTVAMDGRILWNINATYNPELPHDSSFKKAVIDIDVSSGKHKFTIELHGSGDKNTSFEVRNFFISTR